MKTFKKWFVIGMLSLPMLSCFREELGMEDNSSRVCQVRINIEEEPTKVSLEQADGGLDLIARWKEGDKVLVFLNDGKQYWELPESRVRNITPDGKGAVIYYELPKEFRIPSGGYQLYCFTPSCYPMLVDKETLGITASGDQVLLYNTSIVRESMATYSAPVMYSGTVNGADDILVFKHYLAYEVLHVKNETSSAITFSHNGFNASPQWYKQIGALCVDNAGFVTNLNVVRPRQDESETISIPAGGTANIISAYTPNGYKMNKAALVAGINGQIVTSSNTKTSYVTIKSRQAYHMYVTWDGSKLSFDTIESDPSATEPVGGAVDLGLSVKWAGCNVGANSSSDPGYYFAWGEIRPKVEFTWDNYEFRQSNDLWMYNGTDGITILRSEHDAVHYAYGGNWRMPTIEEWHELRNNCDWTDVFEGEELIGYRISSRSNSNYIFLPLTGYMDGTERKDEKRARYWSGSRSPHAEGARNLNENYGVYGYLGNCRYYGMPVRAVYDDSAHIITPGDVVDLGLSVKWAACNVGASSMEEPGNYYAWGETDSKQQYNSETYIFSFASSMTVYNATDGLTHLYREHDVAYQYLGGPYWRMPSIDEWHELQNNCEWISCTVNGQRGYRIESRINGNSIFLPVCGYLDNVQLKDGMSPRYWSNTRSPHAEGARNLNENYGVYGYLGNCRYYGMPVRAVYDDSVNLIHFSEESFVDMGLSVDWSRGNMGASNPEDIGNYYAWGELSSKTDYSLSNYAFQDEGTLIKYNSNDGLTVLEREDDVVYARYKTNHRMPSIAEWQELWNNCDAEMMNINGRYGYLLTSRINQNTIFIPLSGYKDGVQLRDGMSPRYWSNTRSPHAEGARNLNENYGVYGYLGNYRYYGMPVRAVRAKYEVAVSSGDKVDLGLSVKWASANIGALDPEDSGEYYAWGEISSKEFFTIANYRYADNESVITKYDNNDGLRYLDWNDDVVHQKNGGNWRMPTMEEWDELRNNCDWTETTMNGVRGYRIASRSNGNSIFLPCAGYKDGTQLKDGMSPRYWSNTLSPHAEGARNLNENYGVYGYLGNCRYYGMPVRAVYDDSVDIMLTDGEVVDMGVSVKWASRNVGSSSPELFGSYYGWGEIKTHASYSWENYFFSIDGTTTMRKYNNEDQKTVLDNTNDVAYFYSAGRMRMPSINEWHELMSNTTQQLKFKNGRLGYLLTSTINGNSIFLPCAGYKDGTQLRDGMSPRYWSNTRSPHTEGARNLNENYGVYGYLGNCRYYGMPIRAVQD